MDETRKNSGGCHARRLWLTVGGVGLALAALPVVLAGDPPPREKPPATPAEASPPVAEIIRPQVRTPSARADISLPGAHASLRGHATGNIAHGPKRDGPEVFVPDDGGPVRVETARGTIWITQTTPCPTGSDPYPRCLVCHCDIENATEVMGFELDCVFCHGGDGLALTKEEAHINPSGEMRHDKTIPPLDADLAYQQFVNPSNLRVVRETCGVCHPWQVEDTLKSMMATTAGHYAGGLYQNGVVDTKTPIYGNFAITDDDGEVPYEKGAVDSLLDLILYSGGDPSRVATHYAAVPSQACARCHLWSRGKGFRGALGADGVYRADGCAACHVLYANDGLSQSADASIDHEEPGHAILHRVTRQIPTEQCLHCHHRGARIGLSFTGRAQMPPRLPSGPGVPGTTDVKFNGNYHYTVAGINPQDLHGERGLHCIDCHVRTELMGDGNIYGHMDQATKIECRSCHGLPWQAPTLADNDGVPLPNIEVVLIKGAVGVDTQQETEVILTSKVTGAEHKIPIAKEISNPLALCSMNSNHLKDEGGLECYSCHASWVPNCFGCHFERDERRVGLNLMTGRFEVGRASTNNKIFEALRHFSLGPNSEGRVAPYIVGCQPIADVTAPSGAKILDFVMPVTSNGLSGLAMNPVQPHTVRGPGEVRTCAECHRSPPSLGFGSGNYAIARDRVYTVDAAGVRVYDRKPNPGQPAPGEVIPATAAAPARAIAVLPNIVHGTADFLYVAQGPGGVAIYDRRPHAPVEPAEPVARITGVNAIDLSRAARYLYVVDQGVGVRIYDNKTPSIATPVSTISLPSALRVVPWGIHLFVAAGDEGLYIFNIADHQMPYIAGSVTGIGAADVRLYAHYQGGSAFAVRAYVADPDYGVRVIDLLPDFDAPHLVDNLPLPGAVALDSYTRYVTSTGTEPSLEHDYLYVAAGKAGLHIYDMTDPDAIVHVAAVTNLGGALMDVDVVSHLVPPGTDDYALLANATLGLQVVDVNDPQQPELIGTALGSLGAMHVLAEVQQMDRYLDEQGNPLKENSHPFTGIFSRDDIVRILSVSIECGGGAASPDFNDDGKVDALDLLTLLSHWSENDPAGDVDGNGAVDARDMLRLISAWGPAR